MAEENNINLEENVIYDDDNIRTLTGLEHIRLRPGMYIGRLGDGASPEDGIYVLLKEVFDNSIDEFKMKAGDRIEVNIEDNHRISVRDYGRGIPQGKLIDSVSKELVVNDYTKLKRILHILLFFGKDTFFF